MKFLGLDGRYYPVGLDHLFKQNTRNTSSYHALARELIKEVYPAYQFIEEFYMPGCNKLFLDFFIPRKLVAVEVQGKQHTEHNYFFHKSKLEFVRAKKRDANKAEWCAINGITLVQLLEGETEDEWRTKLKSY